MTLLNINELTLDLPTGKRLLDGISIRVAEGETVGLVGESGSGKSLTARSVLGLLPDGATTAGSVTIDGHEVLRATQPELLGVRRTSAAMIFQDPRAGINPMRTIGDHMTEALRFCHGVSASAARETAVSLLRAVRLPRPEDHLGQYPHEFSGGMLQRVMIAGALTSSPKLLICDEPTTALDVTTQAEIIQVLQEQRAARGMGMLFITHDLNLAASICDRVYVMSGGQLVEQGGARQIFTAPEAEYTKRLIAATPSVEVGGGVAAAAGAGVGPVAGGVAAGAAVAEAPAAGAAAPGGAAGGPMVSVVALSKTYHPRGREAVHAVRDAALTIPRGGSLGVVGESGSGKSTLARLIIGLERADAGEIRIAGRERTAPPKDRTERLERARSVQMVFQDPYLSLDPRIPVGRAVEDTLRLHTGLDAAAAQRRVLELLASVGLREEHATARPRTLSGGQRQRVAIARALAVEPDLLVMDEATSALDVSVQAQVLDLLARVREERGITILFISHDLGVVRRVCDETVVMRRGEIVEAGPTEVLLGSPQHEYTRALIDSVPRPAWA
ncbi:dipeptide ABC transporter ATP-binding protein [Leucobacter luti]|uniref:Peptide/nickel transport system ATP-binding protein n=1 Tax=Leucobacter luti TaxID=340320 RepID=A0A4Q7U592_9MICO|nr:ABC transporter ATP-binding protein [Leucobacter luti]MBL3700974.1 ABC transporter ATP-binding protein [Leucobacter luti]RZT68805.1 peptide/nickel transport system ATP-binding protein [Leucobacter luti]